MSTKQCLICKNAGPLKRGLCNADYQRFVRAKAKVKPAEMRAWEDMLIELGRLLPDGRETTDPFIDALKQLRKTSETAAANQKLDKIESAQKRKRRKTPPKKQ